jgi:hypothetical protein
VPPLLNTNALITCIHMGKLMLVPKQQKVLVGGAPALGIGDVAGTPIVGCPQAGPGIKPCTTLVSAIPGVSTSLKVLISGQPALVQTIQGMTDGVPPGMIICTSAGQVTVQG